MGIDGPYNAFMRDWARANDLDVNPYLLDMAKMKEEQAAADLLVTDSESHGNLLITYTNGDVQRQPLLGKSIFPAVECHPATVDFGKILVGERVPYN